MKSIKMILIFMACCTICAYASCQTVTQDSAGNYITVAAAHKTGTTSQATGHFFIDRSGTKYPVYRSIHGKLYVIRTSKKTGNEYKQYLKIAEKH